MRESDPRLHLGRVKYYHYTNGAQDAFNVSWRRIYASSYPDELLGVIVFTGLLPSSKPTPRSGKLIFPELTFQLTKLLNYWNYPRYTTWRLLRLYLLVAAGGLEPPWFGYEPKLGPLQLRCDNKCPLTQGIRLSCFRNQSFWAIWFSLTLLLYNNFFLIFQIRNLKTHSVVFHNLRGINTSPP